jgi:cytoskeletal protein CcmA (bactofilin family)/ribosomal protein S27E
MANTAGAKGKRDQVLVPCPHCGHQQPEPAMAISTNCRACGRYFRVQEALKPVIKTAPPALAQRLVKCFECGLEQPVSPSAQSTLCRKCSRHIDLADYRIASAVSKNFRTHGVFIVETKAYLFNTVTVAGEAVIKGKFLGRLTVERSLTIHSTAEIKGTFQANHLIIPYGNAVARNELIQVGSAEIVGELVANLKASKGVLLKATARFFGDIAARSLVVEEGAVLVGSVGVTAAGPVEPGCGS